MYISNNTLTSPAYQTQNVTSTSHYQYTSAPYKPMNFVALTQEDLAKGYIRAAVPTPANVGAMVTAGLGNVFSADWQQEVDNAVSRNGGLGNETDGYLAYAKNGFVRFYNENLTAEQNRRLAEISLTLGVAIENLPARTATSALTDPDINRWVDSFINSFDNKWAEFLQDPSKMFSLSDGRRHYEMALNPQTGEVLSHYRKSAGGLKGLIDKGLSFLRSSVTGSSGLLGNLLPAGLNITGCLISSGKSLL